jgi:hypothetical protein
MEKLELSNKIMRILDSKALFFFASRPASNAGHCQSCSELRPKATVEKCPKKSLKSFVSDLFSLS